MKKEKINYWKEAGIAAHKKLQAQKIFDAKKHHFRHPKLSDLTFEEVKPQQERSKEEWKELCKQLQEEAKKRKEDRPFSTFHNELVSNLYGKRVDSLKKSTIIAAHEEAIRKMIIKKEIYESLKQIGYNKNKPNLIEINKEHDWNISTFMVIPSSHDMDTLRKIGIELANKLSISMKDFFDIKIWEKSEYEKKLAGRPINEYSCRYHISRNKQLAA